MWMGRWRVNQAPLTEPPIEFIEAAFGIRALAAPLGLYGVGTLGETVHSTDAVELHTLIDQDDLLAGALFVFRGFRFLLNLAPGDVPREARLPSGEGWASSALLYHIARINNTVHGRMSHHIRFKW